MRQFHALEALGLSFFSGALYRDVASHWRGTGARYLLLVVSLGWLPTFLQAQLEVAGAARKLRPAVESGLPRLVFKDGVMSTLPPEPRTFKDAQGKELLLLDTTTPRESMDGVTADILVGPDGVRVRDEGGHVTTTHWRGLPDAELSPEQVASGISALGTWLVPALFPPVVLATWFSRLLLVLLLAFLALPLSGVGLGAAARLRLTAVAMTPARLLDLGAGLVGLELPWMLLAACTVGYLVFALRAVRTPAPAA